MRCAYASSGCNGPREGQCLGLCTHRVNTDLMTHQSVAIAGQVEQIEFAPGAENDERRTVSPLRFAINTFRLYRRWGCSRRASLRHAVRAFRAAS